MKKNFSILSLLLPVLFFAPRTYAASAVNTTLTMPNNALGLVGHWTFDGKDMVNNVADTSGNSNNGTFISMPATSSVVVPGKIGQAINFNGSAGMVQAPQSSSINNLGPMSIAVWIYPRSVGQSSLAKIVAKGAGNAANDWQFFTVNGSGTCNASVTNTLVFLVQNSGSSPYAQKCGADSSLTLNQWQYVVVTWDNTAGESGIHIYKQGTEIAYQTPATMSGSHTTESDPLNIGNRSDGTKTFDGYIDDVRIYNRALSAAEVAKLYKSSSSKFSGLNITSGLVGHWTFDPSDMILNVRDSSGNGNNGDLFGATTTVPGKVGNALSFDGSTNYVTTPLIASVPYTVTIWANASSISSGDIMMGGRGGACDWGPNVSLSSGNIKVIQHGDAGGCSPSGLTSKTVISANKWYFITVTMTATTKTLYINGVFDSSQTGTYAAAGSGCLEFGGIEGATCDFALPGSFLGALDDARLYNRVLSQAEIQELYALGVGVHANTTVNPPNLNSGLVGHWTFDGKDMITNVADTSGKEIMGI